MIGSISRDGMVKLWDLKNEKTIHKFDIERSLTGKTTIGYSICRLDKNHLVVGTDKGILLPYDIRMNKEGVKSEYVPNVNLDNENEDFDVDWKYF